MTTEQADEKKSASTTSVNPETLFAYWILVDRARRRKKITYKELYLLMAAEFGWPDWKPGNAWSKRLPLAQVGEYCGNLGQPCLSALVRQQDGTIGKGYTTAHWNCYHQQVTSHDYKCPCGNCEYLIQQCAKLETQKVFSYWAIA